MWFFSAPLAMLGAVLRNLTRSWNAVHTESPPGPVKFRNLDETFREFRLSFPLRRRVPLNFLKVPRSSREIVPPFTALPRGNMRNSRENRKTSPWNALAQSSNHNIRSPIDNARVLGLTNSAICTRGTYLEIFRASFRPSSQYDRPTSLARFGVLSTWFAILPRAGRFCSFSLSVTIYKTWLFIGKILNIFQSQREFIGDCLS